MSSPMPLIFAKHVSALIDLASRRRTFATITPIVWCVPMCFWFICTKCGESPSTIMLSSPHCHCELDTLPSHTYMRPTIRPGCREIMESWKTWQLGLEVGRPQLLLGMLTIMFRAYSNSSKGLISPLQRRPTITVISITQWFDRPQWTWLNFSWYVQ